MRPKHIEAAFRRFGDFEAVQVARVPGGATKQEIGEIIGPATRNLRLSVGIEDEAMPVFWERLDEIGERLTEDWTENLESYVGVGFVCFVLGVMALQEAVNDINLE